MSKLISTRRFVIATLAVMGAVAIGGPATVAEASTSAGRYAPPPPPPPTLPGYTAVITSQPVGPAGGVIGPFSCDGASHTLDIPPGAFPTIVQITVTCGNLEYLSRYAFTGFTLVDAVGVSVELHGAVYPGTFQRPLTLTARDPELSAGSVAGVWNGSSFTLDSDTVASPGLVRVDFDTDPDFGFFSPASRSGRPVRCVVPKLRGKTLRAARAALIRAHCALGRVRRPRHRRGRVLHVVAQSPRAGTRAPVSTRVSVRLR